MMRHDHMFSRWDILNPTNIIAGLLLGFAFSVYHRPHLPDILPSYAAFDDLMPWSYWGWTALGIALVLLFTPRSSLWRLLAHSLSGLFWLAAGTTFATGVGITSAVTTYYIFAVVSGVLFARTGVHWARERSWWRNLVQRPPRWLRRLAHVDEFAPGAEKRDG